MYKAIKQNNIWIIANHILYKLNEKSNALTAYNFPGTQSSVLSIGEDGNIWAATTTGLIKKYDAASNGFSDFNIHKLYQKNTQVFFQTILSCNRQHADNCHFATSASIQYKII